MRRADPVKLATYLLRNQPEWTDQNINNAMNASVGKWVTLEEQVLVYITYFTAWVDSDGLVNFRKDIYAHDKDVANGLSRQYKIVLLQPFNLMKAFCDFKPIENE